MTAKVIQGYNYKIKPLIYRRMFQVCINFELGKNSAYFGQLATIKSLQMIQIKNQDLCPVILVKCFRILYGQTQSFYLNDLNHLYNAIIFLRTKDVKSCLIGELKKLGKKEQSVQGPIIISQNSFTFSSFHLKTKSWPYLATILIFYTKMAF